MHVRRLMPARANAHMQVASVVDPGCMHMLMPARANAHMQVASVVDPGRTALIVICYNEDLQREALKEGANPNWSPRQTDR